MAEFKKTHPYRKLEESIESLLCCPEPESMESLSPKQRRKVMQTIRSNLLAVKNLVKELVSEKSGPETSCSRYPDLFDMAPVAFVTLDANGRIAGINLAGCELLNMDRQELIGRSFADFVHPEDHHLFERHVSECLVNGAEKTCRVELLADAAKGTLPVRLKSIGMKGENGQPDLLRVAIIDLSEYRQTEKQLKEVLEKYQAGMDNIEDGYYEVDLKGNFIFVNQSLCDHFGYPRESLIGMNYRQYTDTDTAKVMMKEFNQVYATHKPVKRYAFPVIGGGGEKRFSEGSISLIRDMADNAIGFRGIIRDITQQKTLEEKVQHALKMEAIGTLAGGIAHDFNNILGAIVLNTELALDDVPVGTEIEHALDQVLKASQRAKELVDQILTFSRNAEVDRKKIKIDSVIRDTLKMLRAMLPSTILIRRDIAANSWTVMANPTQIQQLVINLCTNAAHAMQEKGGNLHISLQNIVLEPEAAHAAGLSSGRYVELIVSDNGHGIAPEHQERIFDPFFTTKKTGEGTGLGLSVVHGIVLKHRGNITVKSMPGQGSSFRILLPAVNGDTDIVHSEQKFMENGKGKTILFVDDEEALIDAGQRMLRRLGYHVTSTSNPAEALMIFREQPEFFDLVITDMTMPHQTGAELARKMLAIRPDIPIVLCTGFNEKVSPEKARKLGIQGYIMKPYTQQEVSRKLRELITPT
ncbi:MAG: PAS domain-containing sensor histidine kinase [Desulfobacteraceae bacterium]|nr:MAG: PAS domain-containing sensor histidine kinase [Desulfobacteraceae bacterium]